MASTNSRSATNQIDYAAIERSDSFKKFVKKKNTFLFTTAFLFLLYYIMLPVLAFTPVLQKVVASRVFGFILVHYFVMTVIFSDGICQYGIKSSTKKLRLYLLSILGKAVNN